MNPQMQIERLTPAEVERCRSYVKETGEAVLRATVGLTPAQWNFKPSAERWSIAEIVEHMVVVQELVLGPIREQLAQAAVCDGREYAQVDEIIIERFPVRSGRLQAPEPAHPTGRFTPDESLERLIANCGRLREYVETNPDLRLRVIPARPLQAVTQGEFTEMDGYQWVLGVAAHTARHTDQIGEAKGAEGYPG